MVPNTSHTTREPVGGVHARYHHWGWTGLDWAGLAGLTTAYYLQRDGVRVTVIERAEGPGLETSFANGALLHSSLVEPWNAPGIAWKLLRWIGREDAPMLLRPHALPTLLGWGTRFFLNSSPLRFERNTQKNLRLAMHSLALMQELRDRNTIDYNYQARGLNYTRLSCR